jgi:hypothetical protein
MEPHAAIAIWEGEKLTLFDKTQGVMGVRGHLAQSFGIKPENVQVISPFVGGAFGSALNPNYYPFLTAMAARDLKRPVKAIVPTPGKRFKSELTKTENYCQSFTKPSETLPRLKIFRKIRTISDVRSTIVQTTTHLTNWRSWICQLRPGCVRRV